MQAARSNWVLGVACVFAAMLALIVHSPGALAKGGSDLSVTTTGAPSGTSVVGTVRIANAGTTALTPSVVRVQLEIRYPDATPASNTLPAGSASGYYRVVERSLPLPGAIPAGGSVTIAYSINTCDPGVPRFPGAKDMRSVGATTAGSQSASGKSTQYALPARCPVCGNGVIEAGEQCEGGACCSSCQLTTGNTCNDGNACTQTDTCQAGACVGSNPKTCAASDQCHTAGVCSPATGACSNPVAPNGTVCEDNNLCTGASACQAGQCTGPVTVACPASDSCHAGVCDPASGGCSEVVKADGAACSDGENCTVGDTCAAGACQSGAAVVCDDLLSCTDNACTEAGACVFPDTAACESCDVAQCTSCVDQCAPQLATCREWCDWNNWYLVCIYGVCAPLSAGPEALAACYATCPSVEACTATCEGGNACDVGCAPAPSVP